jgi:hypothetical protein
MRSNPPFAAYATTAALVVAFAANAIWGPFPYFWLYPVAIVVCAMATIPRARQKPPRGVYRLAIVAPFARGVLRWHLDGRMTKDRRVVKATTFATVESFAASETDWNAVVVHEPFYAKVRMARADVPLKVMIRQRYLVPWKQVVLRDSDQEAIGPVDLLEALPIDTFVAHPRAKQALLILVVIGVLAGAAIVWRSMS